MDKRPFLSAITVWLGMVLTAGIGIPAYMAGIPATTPGTDADRSKEQQKTETPATTPPTAFQLIAEAIQNEPVGKPGGGQEPAPTRAKSADARWKMLSAEFDKLRGVFASADIDVKFLIATVPDPLDSHYSLDADNALAAIQWALQEHGFLPDRHALPWAEAIEEESKAPKSRDYRVHPGVVLFRKNDPNAKKHRTALLALLIVGETPTSGIDKTALAECLDVITIWRWSSSGRFYESPISIIGPTFSGSAYSLRQSLEDWSHQAWPNDARFSFSVCTGSATAAETKTILSANLEYDGLNIKFEATVIPDEAVLPAVLDYLQHNRRIARSKIALLSEAGTAYGNYGWRGSSGPRLQPSTGDLEAVRFAYPLQIGRLRTEFEKARQTAALREPANSPQPRRHLEFTFDRAPFANDVLPIFSHEAAFAAERELASTLSMISRLDIRALGIMGTDVNDVLFLAKLVRQYAPDVQLFTLENNVLYTHHEHLPYTKGMLVASPYPLFPNNLTWVGQEDEGRLPFPSSGAEGIYNATLVLMNARSRREDRHPLLEYHTPFYESDNSYWRTNLEWGAASLPLWLTMVGHEQMWPVVTLPYGKFIGGMESYVHSEPVSGRTPGEFKSFPSGVIASVWAIASLLCVIAAWLRNPYLRIMPWNTSVPSLMPFSNWRWSRLIYAPFAPLPVCLDASTIRPPADEVSGSRAISLAYSTACGPALILFSGLLFITVCLGSPSWRLLWAGFYPIDSDGRTLWCWLAVMGFSAAATLSLGLILLQFMCLALLQWIGDRYRRVRNLLKVLLFALLVLLVYGIVIVWTIYDPQNPPRLGAAIVSERWATQSSGVSPLISMALLNGIFSLAGLCELRRMHFDTWYHLENPFGKAETSIGIGDRIKDVSATISCVHFPLRQTSAYLFMIAVVLGFVYVFVFKWDVTAEGVVFNVFFILCAALAVLAIGWEFLRLTAVADTFICLLRRLSFHPIRNALGRVPRSLANKTAGPIFAVSPYPGGGERSVQVLERCEISLRSPLRQWDIATARLLLKNGYTERRLPVSFKVAAALNEHLASVSRYLSGALVNFWSTQRPGSTSSASDSWESDAELFVVLQVTNLIRQVFTQVRNLLIHITLMVLLLLWALSSYPFQPHRLIVIFSYGFVLWIVITFILLFVRFNRDEVLSRLLGTTPNRFTFDRSMILPFVGCVVLPLVSLAAVQFPEFSDALFSWIGFFQRAVHG